MSREDYSEWFEEMKEVAAKLNATFGDKCDVYTLGTMLRAYDNDKVDVWAYFQFFK